MNNVQDYLDRMKKEEEKKKSKILLDLGFYEKEYSPDNKESDDYLWSEWNEEKQKTLYYKRLPIKVTDEEFAEILKYSGKNDKSNKNNGIFFFLNVIACMIYIIGGIVSLLPFSSLSFFSVIVEGTLFLAIAEIIQLLTDIRNK